MQESPTLLMEFDGFSDEALKAELAFIEEICNDNGSVFIDKGIGLDSGILAASGTLPFGRETFEAIIKAGGRGIEPSLNAFRAAYDQAAEPPAAAQPVVKKSAKRFSPLPASAGRPDSTSS